ncbi:MAG: NAD(P)/FAD-dependent oxidoreductase [Bacteroidales bacterium]|nr:NAD(P)/FAD-dependent oxidoreductase [Bacteroidales bacterium]
MRREIELKLTPGEAFDPQRWKQIAASVTGIPAGRIYHIRPLKRSIDARHKVFFRLKVELYIGEHFPLSAKIAIPAYADVSRRPPVIIVGAGPAGLFAALTLIKQGFRPVILERGKDVKARKFDISTINRGERVNPDSNYCFGEGGAGTYSDGKLYTRSTKRGDVSDILRTLVAHGAPEDILIDAHPHIGTDKLPGIIASIRRYILESGGEVCFNRKVAGLIVNKGKIKGVTTADGNEFRAASVILATGHSARDVFEFLHNQGILIEPKPFAMGVRIEHPQQLIDSIQYHIPDRGPYLPAATYNLVTQAEGRGVFSFCMCPGGIIVPAATSEMETVVNGMSNSKRNSPFANSGIAVAIEPSDWKEFETSGPFAALNFQQSIERKAWDAAGSSLKAPAQRLTDFMDDRNSASLPESSYNPGLISVALSDILPGFLSSRLKLAFRDFNEKMKGYMTSEAVLVGVESRTSSPVRIPRHDETFQHPQVAGLYPCGEGAGYAGGIVSSALDGVNCAMAIAGKSSG